jgi:hypothetical protein
MGRGNCWIRKRLRNGPSGRSVHGTPGPLPEAPNTCSDSEKRLTDSTVSSAANATAESGAKRSRVGGKGCWEGPCRGVYGTLAERLTAERRRAVARDEVDGEDRWAVGEGGGKRCGYSVLANELTVEAIDDVGRKVRRIGLVHETRYH